VCTHIVDVCTYMCTYMYMYICVHVHVCTCVHSKLVNAVISKFHSQGIQLAQHQAVCLEELAPCREEVRLESPSQMPGQWVTMVGGVIGRGIPTINCH
jgi:hypothetical protein